MTALPQFVIDTPGSSPREAADLVMSAFQRDGRGYHRSRARSCWHEARNIRRLIDDHGYRLNQDQTDGLEEERRDLRREAAEHIRESRRLT